MAQDDRNYLITYIIKMIHKVQPSYIIIENVKPKKSNTYKQEPHNGRNEEKIWRKKVEKHKDLRLKIKNQK